MLYELSNGVTVDMFMIDTVIMCGVNSHGIKVTDRNSKALRGKHVRWLKRQLRSSRWVTHSNLQ